MKKMIKKIEYLNELNDWVNLSLNSNFSSQDKFDVRQFEYFNETCLVLDNRATYSLNQFYFTEKNEVLKIYFNRKFLKQRVKYTNFLTKSRNCSKYSKTLKLIFFKSDPPNERIIKMIKQQTYGVFYNIKFQFIKNLLSIFYKEKKSDYINRYINQYVDQMERKKNFDMINASETNSELEKLIEKLSRSFEVSNELDLNPGNRNILIFHKLDQYHIDNNLKNLPDISLSLDFFRVLIKISNDENIVKIILNFFNVFSFWFNLSVLDFYVCINEIRIIFKNTIKRLICYLCCKL